MSCCEQSIVSCVSLYLLSISVMLALGQKISLMRFPLAAYPAIAAPGATLVAYHVGIDPDQIPPMLHPLFLQWRPGSCLKPSMHSTRWLPSERC